MEAVKSAHRASLRLSRCNEREWNELSIRLFSAVIFSEWLRELFQHFVSGSSWRRINIWKRGKELMTLNETVRRRYLKTRTNKTKTISISPLKSPGSKMKPAEQKEETHTHFLHDEHQLLNMSHRQRQLTHVHVTHSAGFGSIQLFVEGVGGRRSGESNNKRAGDGRNSCSVSWPNNSQLNLHFILLFCTRWQQTRVLPSLEQTRWVFLCWQSLWRLSDTWHSGCRASPDLKHRQKNINIRPFIQSLSDSLWEVKGRSKMLWCDQKLLIWPWFSRQREAIKRRAMDLN